MLREQFIQMWGIFDDSNFFTIFKDKLKLELSQNLSKEELNKKIQRTFLNETKLHPDKYAGNLNDQQWLDDFAFAREAAAVDANLADMEVMNEFCQYFNSMDIDEIRILLGIDEAKLYKFRQNLFLMQDHTSSNSIARVFTELFTARDDLLAIIRRKNIVLEQTEQACLELVSTLVYQREQNCTKIIAVTNNLKAIASKYRESYYPKARVC